MIVNSITWNLTSSLLHLFIICSAVGVALSIKENFKKIYI